MGLRDTARNAGASNPLPYGCVLYLPLWDNELSGAVFNSYDDFRHLCTVIGTVWGNTGRTSDGDDYINIDSVLPVLASTTVGSWQFWGKVPDTTPAGTNALIAFGDTDALELIYISIASSGKISAVCYDGVQQWGVSTDSTTLLTNNTIFQVGLVHNGTTPVIYVNGVAPAQTFNNETNKTRWFSVCTGLDNGRLFADNILSAGNADFLTGTGCEVVIHNRDLTAGEMLYSWNNSYPRGF